MIKLIKKIPFIALDVLAIQISFFLAFYMRFEKNLFTDPVMENYLILYIKVAITVTVFKIMILYFMKMYSLLWKYASFDDFLQIILSSIICTVIFIVYSTLMQEHFPRSIYILTFVFDTILFASVRLSYRVYKSFRDSRSNIIQKNQEDKKVLIVGAGNGGAIVIRELKNNPTLRSNPVAIIDDNLNKIGNNINGIPIVGTKFSIRDIVLRYEIEQIIIAIPSASKMELKEIIDEASKTDCELKLLPKISTIDENGVRKSEIRNVEIADLLGREEIQLNTEIMNGYLKNKIIMVTGGGGSIGSELCRQVALFKPNKIIIVDIYENNAFLIENELKRKFSEIEVIIEIASIRDKKRIFDIVKTYQPVIIFHAAAHKHVPLMENSPVEAIKNNIFGSYNVMEAAKTYKVERFVLISTDKAVNPTNIMGATKRCAEILVQSYNKCETTKFVAVRFGNVLGSNGSVIPTFKKQIEDGGPVTVTHPEITRYFMTIPEAARLVIQASSLGRNGEIFVLDMGEPIKIVALAENLIRLSGLVPNKDINIEFTGLRPGEKMYEELILNEENCKKTVYEKIFIETQEADVDSKMIEQALKEFRVAIEQGDNIREVISKFIPTYEYK